MVHEETGESHTQHRRSHFANCCGKMICNIPCRIVLFIINLLSSIASVILISIGALMVWGHSVMELVLVKVMFPLINAFSKDSDSEAIKQIVERLMNTSAPLGYAILGVGLFIMLVSVLGYVGACFNSKLAFKMYTAVLGVLVVLLLCGIITYYAMKNKTVDFVEDLFYQSIQKYESMEKNDMNSLIVGFISPALHCCGMHNSSEFIHMLPNDTYGGKTFTDLEFPIICCKMDENYKLLNDGCPDQFTEKNSNVNHPCREPFREAFVGYFNYVVFGIAALMGLLLALICLTSLTICIDVV